MFRMFLSLKPSSRILFLNEEQFTGRHQINIYIKSAFLLDKETN